jgi:carboxymethylenebutenolidase
VDCYGGRADPEWGADLRCPLLGLFGEDDQFPSPDDVRALAKVLDEHGKSYDFHSYEGAGHAFFSVDRPSYRLEAAKDGWKQIWAFYGEHLQGT